MYSSFTACTVRYRKYYPVLDFKSPQPSVHAPSYSTVVKVHLTMHSQIFLFDWISAPSYIRIFRILIWLDICSVRYPDVPNSYLTGYRYLLCQISGYSEFLFDWNSALSDNRIFRMMESWCNLDLDGEFSVSRTTDA